MICQQPFQLAHKLFRYIDSLANRTAWAIQSDFTCTTEDHSWRSFGYCDFPEFLLFTTDEVRVLKFNDYPMRANSARWRT